MRRTFGAFLRVMYLLNGRVDEAEDVAFAEAHDDAVLQHCRLEAAMSTDVRLGVTTRGRYCHDAVGVRDHAVTRVDVWPVQL